MSEVSIGLDKGHSGDFGGRAMKSWWVNQGQTFEQEVRGGYMWSPKTQRDGQKLKSYENMLEVRPNDLVYSYSGQAIRALGRVVSRAVSAEKPGDLGGIWNKDGWLVEVEYAVTETAFSPKREWDLLAPLMPLKYSPLDKNGDGNQKMYLCEISHDLGSLLSERIRSGLLSIPPILNLEAEDEFFTEKSVWEDSQIEVTEKEQLVLSRRGQGKFRERVYTFERSCRVTGVTDPRFLIASHIKPWRNSSFQERLDGNNGLMLSPHIDRLFDSGFISFSDKGAIICSSQLPGDVLSRWKIDIRSKVGKFTESQKKYLEYHRDSVFSTEGRR